MARPGEMVGKMGKNWRMAMARKKQLATRLDRISQLPIQ